MAQFYVDGNATGTSNTVCYPAAAEYIARVALSGNPTNADTLQIGTITYTFVTDVPISNNAYDVEIGGGQGQTSNNLIEAINDGTGEGTVYGAGTEAHPVVTAYDSASGNLYIKGASTQAITDSADNLLVESLGGHVLTTTELTRCNWTTTAADSLTVNSNYVHVTGAYLVYPSAGTAISVNIRNHDGDLLTTVRMDVQDGNHFTPLDIKINGGVAADCDDASGLGAAIVQYEILKN